MEAELTAQFGRSLVRIIDGGSFGSGLIISPLDILTAGHVVRSGDLTSVRVAGQAFAGIRAPIAISRHPEFDLALLHLDRLAAAPFDVAHALPDTESPLANVGDQVTAFGISTVDRDWEARTIEIGAIDGVANMFVLNPALPAGFSGGVLLNGSDVAGVTIARNTDSQSAYAYGIGRALDFVRAHARGNVSIEPPTVSPLIRYPIGPMVPEQVVRAGCHLLLNAFINRYGASEAREVVAMANRAREMAGPPTGQAGLIDLAKLQNEYFSISGFWRGAFTNAGLKSPRMIAALLRVIDENALSPAERQERTAFLRRLENWVGESL